MLLVEGGKLVVVVVSILVHDAPPADRRRAQGKMLCISRVAARTPVAFLNSIAGSLFYTINSCRLSATPDALSRCSSLQFTFLKTKNHTPKDVVLMV